MIGLRPKRFPTTVTLVSEPNGEIRMFFCPNCQAPFTQYSGHIISIAPGVPPVEPYAMTRCRNKNCPMVFCLLAVVEMSKKYMV